MPDYFDAGFCVREPAWHGLGIVLADYPGREEAERLAGHDFEVVEIPMVRLGRELSIDEDLPDEYASLGAGYYEASTALGWKALEYKAAREEDPLDGSLLHVAREDYGVVQNSVGWDIAEAMLGEGAKYETGITLKGGSVCSILAYLDEPITIPGDDSTVLPWLNLSWAHDGSGSLSVRPTSIRTVCWNSAVGGGGGGPEERRGVHLPAYEEGDGADRGREARDPGGPGAHEEYLVIAQELAEIKVTKSQRSLFVSELIPMPPEALISDRVKGNVDEARGKVAALFDGPTIPEAHRLTGYGLHLAGGEYLDHLRGARNKETYFGRSMLRREPAKAKLSSLIREVAKA